MPPVAIRAACAVLLLAGTGLLAGCMYDPYTGTYYPCCASPYPYYNGYPGYPPYYGYPYGYQPYAPPYGYEQPPPAPRQYGQETLARRFAQANITHDGRLTLRQAEAAGWQVVTRNFADIDVSRKGYVTLNEIRVWLETRGAPQGGVPG